MSEIVWLLLFVLVGYIGWTVMRGAPYVPTHKKQLSQVFTQLIKLSPSDVVVDLGAGDGVVLKEVAQHGAKAIGYEINWLLVVLMKLRFLRQSNISIKHKDYLKMSKLPQEVTIVYAFASSRDIKRIDKKMCEWSRDRPLWLISYGFMVADKTPNKSLAAFKLYRYGDDDRHKP